MAQNSDTQIPRAVNLPIHLKNEISSLFAENVSDAAHFFCPWKFQFPLRQGGAGKDFTTHHK